MSVFSNIVCCINLSENPDDVAQYVFDIARQNEAKLILVHVAADNEAIVTVDSLTNTMEQIFRYASFPEDKAEALTDAIDRFAALEDRDATDETTRKLRQSIAPLYYDRYYRTIVEYLEGVPADPAIEMFLDFGLLSEKLLTHEQLVELASVKRDFGEGPCTVYSMTRWFMKI